MSVFKEISSLFLTRNREEDGLRQHHEDDERGADCMPRTKRDGAQVHHLERLY